MRSISNMLKKTGISKSSNNSTIKLRVTDEDNILVYRNATLLTYLRQKDKKEN